MNGKQIVSIIVISSFNEAKPDTRMIQSVSNLVNAFILHLYLAMNK